VGCIPLARTHKKRRTTVENWSRKRRSVVTNQLNTHTHMYACTNIQLPWNRLNKLRCLGDVALKCLQNVCGAFVRFHSMNCNGSIFWLYSHRPIRLPADSRDIHFNRAVTWIVLIRVVANIWNKYASS